MIQQNTMKNQIVKQEENYSLHNNRKEVFSEIYNLLVNYQELTTIRKGGNFLSGQRKNSIAAINYQRE